MKTLYKSLLGVLLLLLTVGVFNTHEAQASHFRYGTLSWTPLGNGEVEFTLIAAFRNGYGITAVGQTFTEAIGGTGLNFGDGSSPTGTLTFEVIDLNVDDDFVIAVALDPDDGQRGIRHTYSGGGPFTAEMSGCCRIFDLNNRSSDSYRLATVVEPNSTNGSPTTSLNPIVRVTEDVNTATFTIPATDAEGDDLRFRVATEGEATGNSTNDGIPDFSIDASTGVVTMNTNTLSGSSPFWTEQVIIEELDSDGNVRTQTPIDFFVQEVPEVGNPPTLSINPSGPLTVQVGNTVTYDVVANDSDDPETLDLNLNSALPPGASTSPALPTSGSPPLTSTFTWTPTSGQVGSYIFNYTVEDSENQQDQASITIDVIPEATCPMPTFTESQNGEQVTVTMNANDPSGLLRADFVDPSDNPYLNNLTVVNSDGFTSVDGVRWDPPSPAPTTAEFVLERVDQNNPSASFFLILENGCGEVVIDPELEFASGAASFTLNGSYPNPTRGPSTVDFALDEATPVQLSVYDVMGRKVATLIDRPLTAGQHEVQWNGRSADGSAVASGMYLLRLQAGDQIATRRLTVVK